jgi:hypothetical protein
MFSLKISIKKWLTHYPFEGERSKKRGNKFTQMVVDGPEILNGGDVHNFVLAGFPLRILLYSTIAK